MRVRVVIEAEIDDMLFEDEVGEDIEDQIMIGFDDATLIQWIRLDADEDMLKGGYITDED